MIVLNVISSDKDWFWHNGIIPVCGGLSKNQAYIDKVKAALAKIRQEKEKPA